jgi:hypothetical protein
LLGQTLVPFDAPGAVSTFVHGINNSGTVAGSYSDASNITHGFIRSASGEFTTFDAPGASAATYVAAINANGAIAGSFLDDAKVDHGFLRSADGTVTIIDPPNSQGTELMVLSNTGEVAGVSIDGGVDKDFVRSPSGVYSTFSLGEYSSIVGINAVGTITGFVEGPGQVTEGFLRAAAPPLTTFEIPEALHTDPVGINAGGTIVGYLLTTSALYEGFIRSSAGSITTFQVGPFSTTPSGINSSGAVTGSYFPSSNSNLLGGFIRSAAGAVERFSVAGSSSTEGIAINDYGMVAGVYLDASGNYHGVIVTP